MWREMRKKLREQGCDFVSTRNNHIKVYDREGNMVTVMQRSESCWRNYHNKISELRRKGFAV